MVGAFARRSLRLRYAHPILGIVWVLVQPALLIAVFTFTLADVTAVDRSSYPAFVFAALVPWSFVNSAVAASAEVLVGDAGLVRKVYFPREVAPLGTVLSSIVDLGILLAFFAVLGPILDAGPFISWLWALPLALLLISTVLAAALPLAALNVYYRDFRYALPFLMQFWFFASPIVYPLSAIGADLRTAYLLLNPVAGMLESFRAVLYQGRAPDPEILLPSVFSSLVLMSLGYILFKRVEPDFADVV